MINDPAQAMAGSMAEVVRRLEALERRDPLWISQQIPKDVSSSTVRQLLQHYSASVVFASGTGTTTFPVPFPTACDGLVWGFNNSVGAGSVAVIGNGTVTPSTAVLITSSAGLAATLAVNVWAWGH